MTEKIKKLKLPKNPGDFLYKEEVTNYIMMLEDTGALAQLPENLLMYYVIDTLLNEVNNGGFSQYLTNSSVATYPYLTSAAARLEQPDVQYLLEEFVSETDKYRNGADISNLEISDEFDEILSRLDDAFYDLDEKYNIEKLNRKAYKANFEEGKIKIKIVKERETSSCRYFIWQPQSSVESAIRALLDFTAEFPEAKWNLEVAVWGDMFRIYAYSDMEAIDLDEVACHFDDCHYSFLTHRVENNLVNCRSNILEFGEVSIVSMAGECRQDSVGIAPSGFEKHEYKMKRSFHMGWVNDSTSDSVKPVYISIGYMNLTFDKYDLEEIKRLLTEHAPKYDGIHSVYTENQMFSYPPKDEKIILYQR